MKDRFLRWIVFLVSLSCLRAGLLTFLPAGVVYLSSCQTAEITGRKQFILLSEQDELDMGLEAYRQALGEAKISPNPALQEKVAAVGKKIAEATGHSEYDWKFTVIDDDKTVNAWCLPGGKVAVYTGILKLTEEDDALLATVMGHEVAHATLHHGAERISQELLITLGATGLLIALQNKKQETVEIVLGAFGVGAQLFAVLPFSRTQESEADRVGLIYMAKAGYHPSKALEFWKKMAALSEGGISLEFLSTHPSHETRIEDLLEWQGEAMGYYKKN
ncbi:MAG: M48 family metallopeptidase [Planctomycetes bacterium]|nr:M48 family metallopeptidase [Planctomycetota bacterium]